MNNSIVHLNSLPVDLSFYRERALPLQTEIDAWQAQQETEGIAARVFSHGRGRATKFIILYERERVYYTTLDAARKMGKLGKIGGITDTGMRPGVPLSAEKYRAAGLDYLAFAFLLSAAGYYPEGVRYHEEPPHIKIQTYVTGKQLLKLDAAAAAMGTTRTGVVRKLIDALQD